MARKQISRIKSALTGEEYDLVTNYQNETMSINLSCADEITWENYKVIEQNLSTGLVTEHPINANGECSFIVPMGQSYEVTLPNVGSKYADPLVRKFVAQVGFRSISHEYKEPVLSYETVSIVFDIKTTTAGGDINDLKDAVVTATLADGQTQTCPITVSGSTGSASFSIAYGTDYSLTYPKVDGYVHNANADHYHAGLTTREIHVHYFKASTDYNGVFGIAEDGTYYTIAEISAMTDEQKATIIYGAFAPTELGGTEEGSDAFRWKLKEPCGPLAVGAASVLISKQWANNNSYFINDVDDILRPQNYSDEDCPYYGETTNNDTGGLKYFNDGHQYCKTILEVVKKGTLKDGTALPANYQVPAISYCAEQTYTDSNGVVHTGFLPAYGQLRRLALNKESMEALYNACGLGSSSSHISYIPTITSGYWWTSCQYSETYAVYLLNGGFNNNFGKTYGGSVLVCFDL